MGSTERRRRRICLAFLWKRVHIRFIDLQLWQLYNSINNLPIPLRFDVIYSLSLPLSLSPSPPLPFSLSFSPIRSMFLPYTLTPHLISLTGFQRGSSTFTAVIQLATGHRGTRRAKHSTIKDAISKLASRGDRMECVVLYSNAWYQPWSTLCVKEVTLSEMKRRLCAD